MKHPERFTYAHLTLESVLSFGKHRGETLKKVVDHDPDYVYWAMSNHVIHVDSSTDTSVYVFTALAKRQRDKADAIQARAWSGADWGDEYYSAALGDFL